MRFLVAGLLAGVVWIVTWSTVSLLVDGELQLSRLLPGVAGGVAFAAVYSLLAWRAGQR